MKPKRFWFDECTVYICSMSNGSGSGSESSNSMQSPLFGDSEFCNLFVRFFLSWGSKNAIKNYEITNNSIKFEMSFWLRRTFDHQTNNNNRQSPIFSVCMVFPLFGCYRKRALICNSFSFYIFYLVSCVVASFSLMS